MYLQRYPMKRAAVAERFTFHFAKPCLQKKSDDNATVARKTKGKVSHKICKKLFF